MPPTGNRPGGPRPINPSWKNRHSRRAAPVLNISPSIRICGAVNPGPGSYIPALAQLYGIALFAALLIGKSTWTLHNSLSHAVDRFRLLATIHQVLLTGPSGTYRDRAAGDPGRRCRMNLCRTLDTGNAPAMRRCAPPSPSPVEFLAPSRIGVRRSPAGSKNELHVAFDRRAIGPA